LCDADGVVVAWPNRPAWRGQPVRARLEARLAVPVRVEDDANAAALGEFRLGAGRGRRHGLVMTVGTGVGAGLVLDGRLHSGRNGWAGEIGHTVVQPGGPECACGRRGCLQALASGRALERAGAEHGLASGAEVGAAAARGEAWACEALEACGRWLGLAAANAATLLDLEVVVVGGALGQLGAPLWPALESSFGSALGYNALRRVALERAQLGESAGLLGALGLALDLGRERAGRGAAA
jgi:glucokinase